MEKHEFESLTWIHEVRERHSLEISGLSARALIERTRVAAEEIARAMGLKIVNPRERALDPRVRANLGHIISIE